MKQDAEQRIIANNHEEFMRVLNDLRRNKVKWLFIDVGQTPGQWIFTVIRKPQEPQPDLFDAPATTQTKCVPDA